MQVNLAKRNKRIKYVLISAAIFGMLSSIIVIEAQQLSWFWPLIYMVGLPATLAEEVFYPFPSSIISILLVVFSFWVIVGGIIGYLLSSVTGARKLRDISNFFAEK